MSGKNSAGDLSQVLWDGTDLQIQTEVRYETPARLTTILVADGTVISRTEKPWKPVTNLVEDQRRVTEYHHRLTQALQRLHDKRWVKVSDLAGLAGRLVSVAIRFGGSSITTEALGLMQGASWVALIDRAGRIEESTPAEAPAAPWGDAVRALMPVLEDISQLFGTGPLEDASLKTGENFILIAPREASVLVAEISGERLPEARQMIKRLSEG